MTDWQPFSTRTGRSGGSGITPSSTLLPGLGWNLSREVATTVLDRLYPIEKFAQLFYAGLAILILLFAMSVAARNADNGWSQAAGAFLLVTGCSFIVAVAAAAVGCLVGFLFGIPRSLRQGPQMTPPPPPAATTVLEKEPQKGGPQTEEESEPATRPASIHEGETQTEQIQSGDQPPQQPTKPSERARASGGYQDGGDSPFLINTSLEEISDWLTKIIIGLSLVQFQSFIEHLQNAAAATAKFTVPGTAGGDAWPFFFALIVASLLSAGFMVYLETRTRLTLLFIGALKSRNGG